MKSDNEVLAQVNNYAIAISKAYINSRMSEKEADIIFAAELIKIFENYKDLLALTTKNIKFELLDCLKTHSNKYILKLEKKKSEEFTKKFDEFANYLRNSKSKYEVSSGELNFITQLISKITENAKIIYSEPNHNLESIIKIQALSLILPLELIDYKEKLKLIDKFSFINELWLIKDKSEADSGHVKVKFKDNVNNILSEKYNSEQAFKLLVNYLTRNNILEFLSIEQLDQIYEKMKNIDLSNDENLYKLIANIHDEISLRLSNSKIDDSYYKYIEKFQLFNNFLHEIEDIQFALINDYISENNKFLSNFVKNLNSKIIMVKGLNLGKNNHLRELSEIIKSHSSEKEIHKILDEFNSNLSKELDSKSIIEFNKLDRFASKKLLNDFENILVQTINIIENNGLGRRYLKKLFAKKIAKDYYLPNSANSVEKLRALKNDRIKIQEHIMRSAIADIFTYFIDQSSIKNINYKDIIVKNNIKEYGDFIENIYQDLVSNSNLLQLEIMYKPFLEDDELCSEELSLRKKTLPQIKNSSNTKDKIFSFFGSEGSNKLDLLKAHISK